MDLSILIPTYGRPAKLRACLDALARQSDAGDFEIIVGVDGGDAGLSDRDVPTPGGLAGRVRFEAFPKIGYIAVRHRLLRQARGRIFLSMNDDAYAEPGLLSAHRAAHDAAGSAIVAGTARWKSVDRPTLFDEIVQRTGLVFHPPRTDRAPGYRDCYGLNFSAPVGLALEFGGFPDLHDAYGYDDIEFAHRLHHRAGAEIGYAPGAAVVHDHRFTPAEVLHREYRLGRSAWAYAGFNPEFARELFGRDVRSPDEVAYARRMVESEKRDADRIERRFIALAQHPGGEQSQRMLETLADSWLLLKRYLWRWGLIDAADERPDRWCPLAPPTND